MNELIDLRKPSAGGGSGGHTIQDEGVSLTQRTNLNFIGGAVTVTDNVGNNSSDVTISGNVDGGFANSTYLVIQNIDGGNA